METNLLLQQILTVLLVFLALFLSGRYVWKHFFLGLKQKTARPATRDVDVGSVKEI